MAPTELPGRASRATLHANGPRGSTSAGLGVGKRLTAPLSPGVDAACDQRPPRRFLLPAAPSPPAHPRAMASLGQYRAEPGAARGPARRQPDARAGCQ
eukprot:scaffold539_cov359-Prasinococcus_capsulatus_cf.AAC.21